VIGIIFEVWPGERPDVRATPVEIKAGAIRAVHQHDDVKFHLFIPLMGTLQLTIGSDKPVGAPIGAGRGSAEK
jgi:hypothetical protein